MNLFTTCNNKFSNDKQLTKLKKHNKTNYNDSQIKNSNMNVGASGARESGVGVK